MLFTHDLIGNVIYDLIISFLKPALDDDYQLQRKINAAVDIQRYPNMFTYTFLIMNHSPIFPKLASPITDVNTIFVSSKLFYFPVR